MTQESTIAYQHGKHLLYVEDTVEHKHYVSATHWGEYLRLRKCVPVLVRIFDNQEQLREFIAGKGLLV